MGRIGLGQCPWPQGSAPCQNNETAKPLPTFISVNSGPYSSITGQGDVKVDTCERVEMPEIRTLYLTVSSY